MIETALIFAPDRANNAIFGRPLLERLMMNCERAGIKKFVIEAAPEARVDLARAMGQFSGRNSVSIVESFDDILNHPDGIDGAAPCVALAGNLVLSRANLAQALDGHAANPSLVLKTFSADRDRGGEIITGPVAQVIKSGLSIDHHTVGISVPSETLSLLPFALNGRPEDRDEAELRLAQSLSAETAQKDAPLARWIDRRISWRISYRLARTAITPNMVTIANTIFGLGAAWMLSVPNYTVRLLATIFFLTSIMIDGVDGELARLKMKETKFGGKLDILTDNIVHVAIFVGLLTGCYRASQSSAYLALIPILLTGFAICAYATWRAFRYRGEEAARWLDTIDRWSGRDFAYLLVILALFNRLEYFAWGAAFGCYAFAAVLIWLTGQPAKSADNVSH
ncbi:MAG: CDP-alcohol phosphatidyltransferase family protein [Candidatus Binatus sp.]|uniref:CDP-alcohol phosphatidyltransferase family protein n=1 Tax=Candidatus Binatus sp. TaxID=2811406 RepID=UPI002726B8B8|nr:CDP-alcohol phosphatidyltransferase family protein [Candidatus Binatus sp.]MDO8431438.1 CDP-alcohol phosphatidyltransferase family protein [Candidatus Binatus sp.]